MTAPGGCCTHAHRFRSALVVVQLSVSVALLVGAGLLTKSFLRMQQSGTGFNVESVWTARIAVPTARYENAEARALLLGRFHVDFEDVRSVAVAVLRHRLVLNFHARADGVDADEVVRRILAQVRTK